jgi:hypothetical protein
LIFISKAIEYQLLLIYSNRLKIQKIREMYLFEAEKSITFVSLKETNGVEGEKQ